MEASCGRHLYCLELLEKSDEYELPKVDRDEASGRILAPKSIFDAWKIFLVLLCDTVFGFLNFLLNKLGLGRRDPLAIISMINLKKC